MAVTKKLAKLLVFFGGAAPLQVGCDVLMTLREAADNDVVVAEYGVVPPPWEEEERARQLRATVNGVPLPEEKNEKGEEAGDAVEPLLPPEPTLDDLEMLRDAADEMVQDAADNEPVAEKERERVREKKRKKRAKEWWEGEEGLILYYMDLRQ